MADNAQQLVLGETETVVTAAAVAGDAAQPSGGDVVQLSPGHAKTVQQAVDQAEGAILRMRLERKEKAQAEDEANGEEMLLPPQLEVTIQFDDGMGHWILKQKNAGPFDDSAIWILEERMADFIEALSDRVRKHEPLKK